MRTMDSNTTPRRVIFPCVGQVSWQRLWRKHGVSGHTPPPSRATEVPGGGMDHLAEVANTIHRQDVVRREVIAKLRDFPLPSPLHGRSFCDILAARRGRPIKIWPLAMREIAAAFGYGGSEVPSGLWLADDDTDHILHERQTSRPHQQLIIFHEGGAISSGRTSRP